MCDASGDSNGCHSVILQANKPTLSWFGRCGDSLRLMVMVEYFANPPASAPGDLACALGSADAHVLAGNRCAFADIAGGVDWVERDKVGRTFPDTLGRRSSALGGSFADVSGAPAYVATGAVLMGLLPGGRLRCVGRLLRWLGLAVLANRVLDADGKCECKQRDEWFRECVSHGLNLPLLRFDASAEDSLPNTRKLAAKNARVASPKGSVFRFRCLCPSGWWETGG
jgi:hypothetical protein